jgi:hypothetical protein
VPCASDDAAIYFTLSPDTIVARNVEDNRYMSFTIDDYTTDWRKVRELQGVGECLAVEGFERERALHALRVKFACGSPRLSGEPYRIRPIEVHFVDYDYTKVTAFESEASGPELTSRVYRLEEEHDVPTRGAISTSLPSLAFGAGDVIFCPGDADGSFFVVVDGEVEVRGEGFGADQSVVRLGPGRLFGDQSTLRGQRGALTAHAVTDCTLLSVARDAVRDLLMQQP